MKVLIGAVAAMVLFTASASAQTASAPAAPVAETPAVPAVAPSRCPSAPADPTLPDGATANASAWEAAAAAFDVWRVATQASLDCRVAEAREAQATAQVRTSEYATLRTAALALDAAMQAEHAEFTARPARSRR